MARRKLKLAFITNDSTRKTTYKKRKKGLLKKASELTTLCGIDAGVIIYSPYESQPEVWPNTLGIQRVLAQFKRMPEMEQSKKMLNQESFVTKQISKAREMLTMQLRENREKEVTAAMYNFLRGGGGLNYMNYGDLVDLNRIIDEKLKEVDQNLVRLKNSNHSSSSNEIYPPGIINGGADPSHG